jgi:hypothetical protein
MEIFAIERRSNTIKIEYADGSREEVEAGIYERKNSDGDTVQQRRATAADAARLGALAEAFEAGLSARSAVLISVEVVGKSIEVTYADGAKEEISNGIYERKNAANKTIIERDATVSDSQRLNNLANGGTPTPGNDDGTPDQGLGDVGTPPGVTIDGTTSGERIHGSSKAEHIRGHGGDDDMRGRAGDDLVDGGSGATESIPMMAALAMMSLCLRGMAASTRLPILGLAQT